MELLPEETIKINFSEYRTRIQELAPSTKLFVNQCNGWREFFGEASNVLPWDTYKNLIKALITSNQPPLILATLDFLVLPSPLGESYNDFWLRKYYEYRSLKDKLDEELAQIRANEKDVYAFNCKKYKNEFMQNIKKYNDDYEDGTMDGIKFGEKRDKAHETYTLLCTEEYNKMNNALMGVEKDFILAQYNQWKEIQNELIAWLLQALL
jgi:hypothetical protein